EATNSVISAVLFGALAGSGALPMQRTAFEAAIHRGGVGVKESIAAFAAGFAVAEEDKLVTVGDAQEAQPALISQAVAAVLAEANAFPEPALTTIRAGVERLADYQDTAYAREYLSRLKPIAEADRAHGDGSGQLLAET